MMPHLVQMDKRYRDKGLVVIAEEVQNSPAEAIEKIAKDKKAEFTMTQGTTRPAELNGIPHAVVFDASGKMVFNGYPGADDFDRTIKKALRSADSGDSKASGSRLPPRPKAVIESRVWTNTEGNKITASVLEIKEEEVRFRLKNGRETNYAIAKLSEEDQELIKETAETLKAEAEEDEE